MTPQDRGTILIGAVRYALGRRTYVVSDTCRIVRSALHEVSDADRAIIGRDIRQAIVPGRSLGDDCDDREWRDMLDWMGEATQAPGEAEEQT